MSRPPLATSSATEVAFPTVVLLGQTVLSPRPPFRPLVSRRLEATTSARLKARLLTSTGQVATALCRTPLTQAPMFVEMDTTNVTLTTLTDFVNVARNVWFPPACKPPKSNVNDALNDTDVWFTAPRMGVAVALPRVGLNGLELEWTILLPSLITCAVHRQVSLGPRAITIMRWLPVILPSRLTTRMEALELSVLAGLLVSMTLGLPINVCVTVMCRTRLLESRPGPPPIRLFKFIRLSVPCVCL